MRIHLTEAERSLGERVGVMLRSRRKFWDYTCQEVAKETDFTDYMIERCEQGQVRFFVLVRMLNLLGVSSQQIENHFSAMISEGLPQRKLMEKADTMQAKRDMGGRLL